LDLRIKPRKRLKRNNPDALTVPDAPNVTPSRAFRHSLPGNGSMDLMADRLGEPCCVSQDHVEQWLVAIAALADDLKDFPRRRLALQPHLQLAELADILDGDDGLGREGFDHGDLVGGKKV